MKIKNATFAQAVRLPNHKVENFIDCDKHQVALFYEPKEQLLYINTPKGTKLVGITNIIEMTQSDKEEKKKSE